MFYQANALQAMSFHQKKLFQRCHTKHLWFTHILEIFVIAQEEMHQQLQHCNGITEYKEVENQAPNHVFVN